MGMSQYGSYFKFDDIQSNEYGVWISGTGTYDAPERDVVQVDIPGRNGNLIIDNNRFRNIEITYPAFISRGFDSRFDIFKAALLSKKGYKILTDTYHPDEFRLACYKNAIEPTTGPYNRAGSFDITFDCQPQRYLLSGLDTTTIDAPGVFVNPTQFTAKPNIRVYGYGAFTIGSVTVTVTQHSYPYIDIDCEAMDARYDATNCNSLITLSGDSFPVLEARTGVSLGTNISKLEVQPRWWTI